MSATADSVPVAGEAPKPTGKAPGKKLSKIEDAKDYSTGKASDVGRQLGFAGIATVWLLRDEQSARPFEITLLAALILLATALLVDFLQYVYCSWVWRGFYKKHFDEHNSDDVDVDIPDRLTDSIYRFFWSKIAVLLIGYAFLMWAAIGKLKLL